MSVDWTEIDTKWLPVYVAFQLTRLMYNSFFIHLLWLHIMTRNILYFPTCRHVHVGIVKQLTNGILFV